MNLPFFLEHIIDIHTPELSNDNDSKCRLDLSNKGCGF